MADNNMMILMGLGMAALWFMNRGGSQEDQVDQLAGASMMAAGEGTVSDAPFQAYSPPANPIFFFNQGGQMTKVPGTSIPVGASSDEDIGIHPGGGNPPELNFKVAPNPPAAGTSDTSPNAPQFRGSPITSVTASTLWDQQALIASANFMPLLAIQDVPRGGLMGGGGIDILGSNVDISNLSSKESFRAFNVGDPTGDITGGFTTSLDVLSEYVAGFKPYSYTPVDPYKGRVVNQPVVAQTAAPFVPFDAASFGTTYSRYDTGRDWI